MRVIGIKNKLWIAANYIMLHSVSYLFNLLCSSLLECLIPLDVIISVRFWPLKRTPFCPIRKLLPGPPSPGSARHDTTGHGCKQTHTVRSRVMGAAIFFCGRCPNNAR